MVLKILNDYNVEYDGYVYELWLTQKEPEYTRFDKNEAQYFATEYLQWGHLPPLVQNHFNQTLQKNILNQML